MNRFVQECTQAAQERAEERGLINIFTTVYVVMDADYDNSWIEAVYGSKDLAEAHQKEMGGWIDEKIILSKLREDVASPVEQAKRDAKRAEQAETLRLSKLQRWVRFTPPTAARCIGFDKDGGYAIVDGVRVPLEGSVYYTEKV